MREPLPEAGAPPPGGGRRVAFFGGSFDPPHLGHLSVARAARAALKLDTVLFAPVGAQPLKPHGSAAGFKDRLAMTRLAIQGEPGFAVSLADAPLPSGAPNYTLESLLTLRAGLEPEGALFCLIGADSFVALRRWHRAAEIPFVAPLIVASRPSQSRWRLGDLKRALPQGLSIQAVAAPDRQAAESLPAFGSGNELPATASLSASPSFSEEEIELRRYLVRNPSGERVPFYLLPGLLIEISASQIRDQIRGLVRAPSGAPKAEHQLLTRPVFDYIRAHGLYG